MLARRGLNGVAEDLATITSQGPAVVSKVATVLRTVGPYVNTLVRISNDPALPQFMQRIDVLSSLESGGDGTTPPSSSPTTDRTGVGLKHFIAPLDAYIYVRRNPLIGWLVGAGAILFVAGVGYRLGQSRAVR